MELEPNAKVAPLFNLLWNNGNVRNVNQPMFFHSETDRPINAESAEIFIRQNCLQVFRNPHREEVELNVEKCLLFQKVGNFSEPYVFIGLTGLLTNIYRFNGALKPFEERLNRWLPSIYETRPDGDRRIFCGEHNLPYIEKIVAGRVPIVVHGLLTMVGEGQSLDGCQNMVFCLDVSRLALRTRKGFGFKNIGKDNYESGKRDDLYWAEVGLACEKAEKHLIIEHLVPVKKE